MKGVIELDDLLGAFFLYYMGFLVIYFDIGTAFYAIKKHRRHKKNDPKKTGIKKPTFKQRIYRNRYENYVPSNMWRLNVIYLNFGFAFLFVFGLIYVYSLLGNADRILVVLRHFVIVKLIVDAIISISIHIINSRWGGLWWWKC